MYDAKRTTHKHISQNKRKQNKLDTLSYYNSEYGFEELKGRLNTNHSPHISNATSVVSMRDLFASIQYSLAGTHINHCRTHNIYKLH